MTRDRIKAIALARGFTERQQADGSMDLNGYVYALAEAIYAEGRKVEREACAKACLEEAKDWPYPSHANAAATMCSMRIRALEVKPS